MTMYRVDHLFLDDRGETLEVRAFSEAATFAAARMLTAPAALSIARELVPSVQWTFASGPSAGIPGVTRAKPPTVRSAGRARLSGQ